jgi:murein DD-endopeptidase MepM/ murein hydrolase activator NlpD
MSARAARLGRRFGRLAAVVAALSSTALAGPLRGSLGPMAPSDDPALAVAMLDRRIADIDFEEQTDKTELSRTATEVAVAKTRLVVHGRAFYKLTRAGLLPVGGGFEALVSHAMHVERAKRVLVADLQDEQHLDARADELGRALERLARDRVDLATQRQAMDAARLAAQDQLRRQAAFDRAFETSSGAGADYIPVSGGAGGPIDPPTSAFASARGRLLFPLAGRADVRPARREGTDGPGLELHAPAGTVVRAVFAGRVAFADRYGPYGRIVILDHGSHYFTVSGNLDQIDVRIGQDVSAGDRIGTVGDDGAGPMLYFEVRQGSQTVAPASWLGL